MLDNGDSTLIISPRGKKIIIDGGEKEQKILTAYLLARKIKTVDYAIITHFDSDHFGGIKEIMENLKIKNLVITKQMEKTKDVEEIINLAKKKKIKILIVKAGDKIDIEKYMHFTVLWPKEDKLISENAINNNSIVAKLTYKNTSALFTGDIEEKAEKEILNLYKNNPKILKANVLKIAHHGSKTSSTIDFLNAVKPEIALIGVGQNNKFGHPSENTIEKLKSLKTKIYRTDKMGEICIEGKRTTILMNSE